MCIPRRHVLAICATPHDRPVGLAAHLRHTPGCTCPYKNHQPIIGWLRGHTELGCPVHHPAEPYLAMGVPEPVRAEWEAFQAGERTPATYGAVAVKFELDPATGVPAEKVCWEWRAAQPPVIYRAAQNLADWGDTDVAGTAEPVRAVIVALPAPGVWR